MHRVKAKSILSAHNGMNIYRGCQHGCIYCDSRSKCYHIEHAFEDIEVKENAPELLEMALSRKRQKCMIGTGSMSDPYMPLERELGHMRRCLEIINRYGFGATVITKSPDVLRDLDLFEEINNKSKAVVQMTLTTYDDELCRVLEPGVAPSSERFETLKILREHDIPTVVWISPILPYINDTEKNIRGLMRYCAEADVKGIICFGMGLTLREGDREYYYAQLDRHFPGMKQRYIRDYGYAYELTSPHNAELMAIVRNECKSYGIMYDCNKVFAYLSTYESKQPEDNATQLSFI